MCANIQTIQLTIGSDDKYSAYTVKDRKYFHKINFPIDISVFSCSLEIIFYHYCSMDCDSFSTGRKLDELCK